MKLYERTTNPDGSETISGLLVFVLAFTLAAICLVSIVWVGVWALSSVIDAVAWLVR